jgi:hypothetical protein
MIESYLLGAFFAFLLGLYKVGFSFSTANSIRFKNLNQINLYYDYLTGGTLSSKPSMLSNIIYVSDVLILGPIFSWITIITFVYKLVIGLTNKVSIPERIKEIQFKIASAQLPKEQVVLLVKETEEFYGIKGAQSLIDNSADNTLILEDKDWYADLEIEPSSKIYRINSHPPDYMSDFKSKHEYKIEDHKVYSRLIEECFEHAGDKEWSYDVKDNVVLESQIHERESKNKFSFKTPNEKIDELRNQVSWCELKNYKIKYFILSKHPEILPQNEFRKYLRQEKERILEACRSFKEFVLSNNLISEDTEEGLSFQYPENSTDEEKKKYSELYQEFMNKNNFDWNEIGYWKVIDKVLKEYLGEKP